VKRVLRIDIEMDDATSVTRYSVLRSLKRVKDPKVQKTLLLTLFSDSEVHVTAVIEQVEE
jgi:hypothetical protein